MSKRTSLAPYLQVAPLTLVLMLFFVIPVALVLTVSFFRYRMMVGLVPDFTFKNYIDLVENPTTWRLYLSTIKFTVIVLALTFAIGFWIAYFLVFHVKNLLVSMGLFLLCTIPFWTSNIIRMISWRPVLGKEGLINDALMSIGLIHHPLTWLLYSDFSVIVAYVHLNTLFMIVPIFNSMARIDPALLEVVRDAGGSRWAGVWISHHQHAVSEDIVESGLFRKIQVNVNRIVVAGGAAVERELVPADRREALVNEPIADRRGFCGLQIHDALSVADDDSTDYLGDPLAMLVGNVGRHVHDRQCTGLFVDHVGDVRAKGKRVADHDRRVIVKCCSPCRTRPMSTLKSSKNSNGCSASIISRQNR
jgi:ABC-type spermidine/putrescine transport system permease subunit I